MPLLHKSKLFHKSAQKRFIYEKIASPVEAHKNKQSYVMAEYIGCIRRSCWSRRPVFQEMVLRVNQLLQNRLSKISALPRYSLTNIDTEDTDTSTEELQDTYNVTCSLVSLQLNHFSEDEVCHLPDAVSDASCKLCILEWAKT